MRKRIMAIFLSGGILLGTYATLHTRAADKQSVSATKNFSRVQVVTYFSGLTGFFDPASGRIYLYDADLNNCVMIRELGQLGEPMRRINN